MNNLTAQGEHQHVVCRMAEWSTLFGKDEGSPTFSPDVKLYAPEDQDVGHRDRVVVLQVLTKGPGNVSRGTLNECTLEAGDMVLANHYHRGLEFTVFGESVVCFDWDKCMALLKVSEEEKMIQIAPLQAYVICKRNEKRAEPIFMGERATGKRIILPGADAMDAGGAVIDERGKIKLQPKVACEEVVECGPGAVVDGLWSEPRCRPGDMVIYDTSVAPVQCRIQGQAFTLVHWRHILLTIRNGAAEVNEEAEPMNPGTEDAATTTVQ